jgi:hypothetical protein
MSSVVVTYPVEIKGYRVSVQREQAEILLDGVEGPMPGEENPHIRRVGRMTFGNPTPIGEQDFILRGGMLQMDRPLDMFSGILQMLQHEQSLFLRGDGILATSLER